MRLSSLLKSIKESPNKIGLTGGTASGKTTVSRLLGENQFSIIDFDKVAVEVRAEPQIKNQIESYFGTLEPRLLRERIFNDQNARSELHKIMEYRILERGLELNNQIVRNNKGPAIWDAALLIEFGLHQVMNQTVLVTCSNENRLARLTQRDNINLELAQKMVQAQTTDQEKIDKLKNYPHHIIENNSNLENLESNVKELMIKLRSSCG
jgi:dephospho-CoA kinase